MTNETSAIILIAVMSSIGVIFFIAFFILKIVGLDLEKELYQEAHEIFEKTEKQSLLKGENGFYKNEEQENQIGIICHIFNFIDDSSFNLFIFQIVMLSFFGFVFLIVCLLIFEDGSGAYYITIPYIFGILFSFIFNYLSQKIGKIVAFKNILESSFHVRKLFSSNYYAGFTLVSFFIASISFFFMITLSIYKNNLIGDKEKTVEAIQKCLVYLFGGFGFGYILGCSSFRISDCIYQSGVMLADDLVEKSDLALAYNDLRNPCSLAAALAEMIGQFKIYFMDISSGIVLVIATSSILLGEAKEDAAACYFPLFVLNLNIGVSWLVAFLTIFLGILSPDEETDLNSFQVRIQSLATSFIMIILVFFTPIAFITGKKYIFLCLFLGLLLEKILTLSFEYFSNNYLGDSLSLSDANRNKPGFNLIRTQIFNNFFFPLTLVIFGLFDFIGFKLFNGYFGIGILEIGLISNIIPIVSIFAVSSLANNSMIIVRLSKMVGNNVERMQVFAATARVFKSHLLAMIYGLVMVGAIAGFGSYVSFLENSSSLPKFQNIQLFGIVIGFSFPYFLNGIVMNRVKSVAENSLRTAGQQLRMNPGIMTYSSSPDHLSIAENAKISSVISASLLIVLNSVMIYVTGILMGPEFLVSYQIGFCLTSSFILFNCLISGNEVSDTKKTIEYNRYNSENPSGLASLKIEETYAKSFKDSSSTLFQFICFNAILSLVGGRHFAAMTK